MDYKAFQAAVATDAALRRRRRLQPVGGQGDKIFPPTYPGEGRNAQPRHVLERRRVQGADIWCALVDSVQSQANRLEEALLGAIRDGSAQIPYLKVDFSDSGLTGVTEITSLDAPHRVYDAILRDSVLDGKPFPETEIGQALKHARPIDATALLEASPTALVFGAWNSTGEGGGIGAKFPRILVSEIAAMGVPVDELADPRTGEIEGRTAGQKTSSRIDPLGILRKVEVFQAENKAWDVDASALGKKAKKVRPSEINHGNIAPSVQKLGITCDYLEHTAVLSFAGLRRLGFGGAERDVIGRALLATLGILALVEQDARGYALRSRCDLVCEGRAPTELVHADGSIERVEFDLKNARQLYSEALRAARAVGFKLNAKPITLTPQPKLVEIVRRSQEIALAGEGGEAEGE